MESYLKNPVGKVIVIGGGIGGIQCALDLADTGFYVYLIEKSHTLGGTMARLDKTFPTNDCSTCMFSPKMVHAAGHANIEILCLSRLLELNGVPGRFTARIEKQPRYINEEKCIACGKCAEKCPVKVPDPFNGELGTRKAAFLTFPQAVPLKYAIDAEHCLYFTKGKCGICKKVCPAEAIEYDQKPEILQIQAGAVILSTGFEPALTVMEDIKTLSPPFSMNGCYQLQVPMAVISGGRRMRKFRVTWHGFNVSCHGILPETDPFVLQSAACTLQNKRY
jgi:heterodisulfide reductase subunit A